MSVSVPALVNPARTAKPRPLVDRSEPDHPAPVEAPRDNAPCSRLLTTPTVNTPVTTRSIFFRGEIRRGPHAGLVLTGKLRFIAGPGGGVTTELIGPDGVPVAAARVKITGRAITLTLLSPDRGLLQASGTFEHDPIQGGGLLTGMLTGPAPGDLGDWRGVFASGEATGRQTTPDCIRSV